MRNAVCLLVVVLLMGGSARPAEAVDDTGRSAQWLLERATLVQANGGHNVLLRALRQMRDPSLQPLFENLVQRSHPALQIHGILGLAEIADPPRIDLELLAELEEPAVQAQLVSSALETDLLTIEQCEQLMAWPKLDTAVKIIVATRLVSEEVAVEPALLDEAREGENPAMAGMAALLKMELGDRGARQDLDALNSSTTPGRDNVRAMLLQTSVRFDFSTIGPWALEVAEEPRTNSSLRLLALRTAMRFDAPRSVLSWTQRFESSTSAADRIRLAMLAMDLADQLEPELFDLLLADDQEVVQQMGEVGQRVASGEPAQEAMLNLLEHNHLLASKWVLEHAKEQAIEDALPLLVGLVLAAEDEPDPARFRGQRLENAVMATQDIAERSDQAPRLIVQLLRSSPALTQEAILMGLIRAKHEAPHDLIANVTDWPNDTAASLALLLKAKHGVPVADRALQDLALIVRGGAGLQDPLRVQAAWIYLKQTGQEQEALASVLQH